MWRYKHKSERPNRIVDVWWIKYKLVRMVDKTETDIHHILGRCLKNKYNVYADENKIRIPRWDHMAYNLFVKDKQNPREAMQKMYEMCKQVLTEETRARLVDILYNTDDKDFYIQEVLKWPKKKK